MGGTRTAADPLYCFFFLLRCSWFPVGIAAGFDLRLPHVEVGYEDPDSDIMGKIGRFFGFGKKPEEKKPEKKKPEEKKPEGVE